jgi:hypothetical protein
MINSKKSVKIDMNICRVAGLLVIVLLLGISGCGKSRPPMFSDVYIWQRQWTPAVSAALQSTERAVRIRNWRVLAGEISQDGTMHPAYPDFKALAMRPVTLVIRIDGQLSALNDHARFEQISAVLQNWQAHQLNVTGIEIDHDCGTQRLAAYAGFLGELRQKISPLNLSITALPDWIHSPQLPELLNATDSYVLQVHAVQNPAGGLFNAPQATLWVNAFDKISHKPFQVALPDYGSRVSWNERGDIVGIESERPQAIYAKESKELISYPAAVQDFMQKLSAHPPRHLDGFAWFRLPLEGDRRTWDAATWQAVMNGRYVEPPAQIELNAGESGMYTVSLYNPAEFDAVLPAVVTLDRSCMLGDGANEYRWDEGRLTRLQSGLLHPHSRRIIGWTRCDNKKKEAHAEQ